MFDYFASPSRRAGLTLAAALLLASVSCPAQPLAAGDSREYGAGGYQPPAVRQGTSRAFHGVGLGMSIAEVQQALLAGNARFQFAGTFPGWRPSPVAPVATMIACDGRPRGDRCDPPFGDANYERVVVGFSAVSGRVFYVSHVWFPAPVAAPSWALFRDELAARFNPVTPAPSAVPTWINALDAFDRPDPSCLYTNPNAVPGNPGDRCGFSLTLALQTNETRGAQEALLEKFTGILFDERMMLDAALGAVALGTAAWQTECMRQAQWAKSYPNAPLPERPTGRPNDGRGNVAPPLMPGCAEYLAGDRGRPAPMPRYAEGAGFKPYPGSDYVSPHAVDPSAFPTGGVPVAPMQYQPAPAAPGSGSRQRP